MARIQNPFIGRASGSAGGMVFQKQFDQNIIRAKPFEGRWSNTPAQVESRAIVSLISAYAKGFDSAFLIRLFPNMPLKNSRYAELLKQLQIGRDVTTDPVSINPEIFLELGNGFESCARHSETVNTGTDLVFYWYYYANYFSNNDDPITIITFNEDLREVKILNDISYPEIGSATVPVPIGWESSTNLFSLIGSTVHLVKSDNQLSKFHY